MNDHRSDAENRGPGDLVGRFKELFGLSVSDASEIVYREALRQRRGNVDDAQDLAQAVWERIVSQLRLEQLSHVRIISAWLRQNVRSVAVDEHRRASAQKRSPEGSLSSLDVMVESEEPAVAAPGPEDVAAARDLRDRLQRAILLLPENQQSVVLLVMNGFTHAEIAEELSVPIGTVKTRFRAAAKNLRGFASLVEH